MTQAVFLVDQWAPGAMQPMPLQGLLTWVKDIFQTLAATVTSVLTKAVEFAVGFVPPPEPYRQTGKGHL